MAFQGTTAGASLAAAFRLLGASPSRRPRLRARPPLQGVGTGYTRGVRQRLAQLAWGGDWASKHDILVLDYGNKSTISYGELMLTSKFCVAIPGAPARGWGEGGWDPEGKGWPSESGGPHGS